MDTETMPDLNFGGLGKILRLGTHPETSTLSARYIALMIRLAQVLKDEERTVKALARDLNLGKPAVSRGLDALEAKGWVKRVDNPDDKRTIFARVTAAGRACPIFTA